MKQRKLFILLIGLAVLGLCGCMRQGATHRIRPSAVPDKYLTKTAMPLSELNADEDDDEKADPWLLCETDLTGNTALTKISELTPREYRRRVQITFMIQDADASSTFVIQRCMGGKVYACLVNEQTSCTETPDLSTEPNDRMLAICADPDLNGMTLTTAATGRNSIFEWQCRDGAPVITAQLTEVDAAGYDKSLWFEIPKP